MNEPDASTALAPTLASLDIEPRRAFERVRAMGFTRVQLSATQAGLRPRELDRSARRDMLSTLGRFDLTVSGIDAWIPPEHFLSAAHADRAVSALHEAIELAADLGRVPVSMSLPTGRTDEERADVDAIGGALVERAEHCGVSLADHVVPDVTRTGLGAGIDPAAWLARDEDPAGVVGRLTGRLVAARLCDLLMSGQRGPVGRPVDGRLDVHAYRAALGAAEYAGPVVVDARQWTEVWSGLVESAAAWAAAVGGNKAAR